MFFFSGFQELDFHLYLIFLITHIVKVFFFQKHIICRKKRRRNVRMNEWISSYELNHSNQPFFSKSINKCWMLLPIKKKRSNHVTLCHVLSVIWHASPQQHEPKKKRWFFFLNLVAFFLVVFVYVRFTLFYFLFILFY